MLDKLTVLFIVCLAAAASTSLATPVHTRQIADPAEIARGFVSSDILSDNSVDDTIGGAPNVLGSLGGGSPLGHGLIDSVPGIIL